MTEINEHPSMQPANPKHRGEPIGTFGPGCAERNLAECSVTSVPGRECAAHFPVTYARDHAKHRAIRVTQDGLR
jgi:hypothetical protein